MKLFVIGATGRTGREIVEQALARGHRVTAFVRSPESITSRNERLAVIKGNAMDENELFNAMQNHDAVLSTLGPREVFKPSSMLHDSALATTRAMNRSGVKRLVVLSAAAHFPGIPHRIASFIMANHILDSLNMAKAGVSESWITMLGILKAAGAIGLLVGIGVPLIGTATAVGLVLFFVGAIITHLRARDYSFGLAIVFLLLAVAALVLRLVAS